MDLERIKKRNALFDRGAKLIEQARKLDVEANYLEALPVYTEAIETLFQTLQYVSDQQDKKQLRTLIEQFLSRAEEIKAIFAQQQELLQYYQQRHSAELTHSLQQWRMSESTSAPNYSTGNGTSAPNYSTSHGTHSSDVMSAVQQLEAIQVPAEPPKKVLGRLARTSVAVPGTSQSMTPVTNALASNTAQSASTNQPLSPSSAYSPGAANTASTNPWASAITATPAQPSPGHMVASPYQHHSPYSPNKNNTASYSSPYLHSSSGPYNNNSGSTTPYASNPYASPYQSSTSAPYAPSSPYTAPYSSPTHPHTSPRTSQHYATPVTGPYAPAPYNAASFVPGSYVDQYGNAYPLPYPALHSSVLPQPQYPSQPYSSPAQPYSPQPYSPHTAQSYYDRTSPHQNYAAQHSPYSSDSRHSAQSNPWGNYATSSCDPCDPCTVSYQCVQGLPMSATPVTVSQVQYAPVMSNSAAQSWPQQYTTQFTDLTQFINNNNLAAAVPQPDRDREKIIQYFVSKGFQRQHVESSYDYLRKMNLQVNADFVEILKDALLVYPTTGTAATSASGTPASAVPSSVPSNLLSEVNTLPRPQWVSDDKAPQCKICAAPFTVLFRRHHCRGCGNVVCALCSDKEVPLPKLGYIHPVRVCKNCYENRELVEIKTTSDTSTVKVAAATFTKSVSDSLSKGTDFLYTQFFSAVARSTALSPAEIAEIARTTKLSESEVSAHHLTFQEHKSPVSGDYELHNYRYVLGPFGYSQPANGPDVVEWLYATLHYSFYQGTSTEPKGVPFKDYIATMGTLLRGTSEARARLGYTTLYIADQLNQTPLDVRRLAAPTYVLDKRKYLRRETARLPQSVALNDMRVSVDHVTAVLFGVVEWLRSLKINMDRRHERIEAALALLQQHRAPLTYASYLRHDLATALVRALLYGKARAPDRTTKSPSGHVVFPGHPHFNVMISLMFAMQLAVDSAESNRPIVSSDFSEKRSDQTPCWPTTNPQLLGNELNEPVVPSTFYNVKIYTPTVWRAIRNKFGISETDLLSSIGLEGLIWPWLLAGEWRGWSQQGSYGKSGSMFFYSRDGQFLLKTISASEAESLREMLAKYHDHVTTGPTLLTPFLGLLQLKDNKGKAHHVLVMRSVFTTQHQISVSYDLKGSVAGRITTEKDRKPGAPMKDLDFDRVVELQPALHQRLLSTLARDSKFLQSQGVMDYSLLLGITHQAAGAREVQTSDGGWPAASGQEVYYMGIIDYLVKFTALKLLESTFKSFKYARHEISALPPDEYAERFLTFMQSIFKIR